MHSPIFYRPLRSVVPLLLASLLSACGGAGRDTDAGTDGLPVIANGFVGWSSVETTPDGALGVRNGQGQSLVSIEIHDANGADVYPVFVGPGALWSSGEDYPVGTYMVRVHGQDGRTFARYFRYDPSIGWDAAVVSNANWEIDL